MRFLKFSDVDIFPRRVIKICVYMMVINVAVSIFCAFMGYFYAVLDMDIILLMLIAFAVTMHVMDCFMYID